ncbi:MAG: helix-turn-helix transcriptional regulator [Candidatus Omnitrophica bacterium]|nr:helix-turn-helix transcriptional regulator [Candidatus Omnitrophota bacterium]
MQIGGIIHKIRKEHEVTLVELADKSGVALATLSRMENGKMTGTLESHMKICEALDITLPELYKNLYPSKKAVDIQKQKSRADVFIHDKKSSEEMLASKVLNKKMMPVLIKIAKGGRTHKEETKSGIEKFIYILDGKIEANIGEEKYNLGRNDSLYFESNIPHYIKNIGASDARVISVVCPPTL